MASVSKKRKKKDIQATFDALRQAALNEHKLRTERGEWLLKVIKDASTEFKQLVAAPKPAFEAYKAFADDHAAALKSKKVKRHSQCSHPGCDAPMRDEVCEAGHPRHFCQALGKRALGLRRDCRACQRYDDRSAMLDDCVLLRHWKWLLEDM